MNTPDHPAEASTLDREAVPPEHPDQGEQPAGTPVPGPVGRRAAKKESWFEVVKTIVVPGKLVNLVVG